MKKILFGWMTAMMLVSFTPAASFAGTNNNTASTEAAALIKRLEDISRLDPSAMSRSEKKEIRKEVRSISEQLKPVGGGVYISVGALILILILLIIFL